MKMKQDIIPRVWKMAEKEKEHLNWLIDNNAPKEIIETSRKRLSYFRRRHKEYNDYVANCHYSKLPAENIFLTIKKRT